MVKKNLLINVKDYLIAEVEGRKQFVQCIARRPGEYKVVIDNHHRAHPDTQQIGIITREDVLANLGKQPYFGSSYGLQIEPFLSASRLKPWGEIFWFVDLAEQQRNVIISSLLKVSNELKELDLLSCFPIETFIRHKKGKHAGNFKHTGREEELDQLTLRLHDFNRKETYYTIWHEMGHYLEFNLFRKKQMKRWINLYHANVELIDTTMKDLKTLYTDFAANGDIEDFGNNLEEDSKEEKLWNQVMGFISEHHSLTHEYLEVLDPPDIKKLWPNDPLQLSNLNTIVTEYAMKNPSELWCESLAHYKTKLEIPVHIRKAVRRTLEELRGN